jgi:hypothetical protein
MTTSRKTSTSKKKTMTPLTANPEIVVLCDEDGGVKNWATNIAPASELKVRLTTNPYDFDSLKQGKPFTAFTNMAITDMAKRH